MKTYQSGCVAGAKKYLFLKKTDIALFAATFVFFFAFMVPGVFIVAGEDNENVPQAVFSETYIAPDKKNTPESMVLLSEVQDLLNDNSTAICNNLTDEQYIYDRNPEVVVFDTKTGTNSLLALEEYVTGVLLAEMPTTYEPEALKAQAVSCRTYALYKMTSGVYHENGADLCTNPAHCQAFAGKNTVSDESYQKAREAVKATEGEIMLYEDKPILAVFHASSGKNTKSSEEVWGGKLSYLCSVRTWETENPGLTAAKSYTFTLEEFSKRLSGTGIELPCDSLPDISTERTSSGKVLSVTVDGNTLDSSDFVNIFGLRSSDFDISVSGETVDIVANGYGHGVGLSQLGAQDLAQKGYSYREILGHYYTGINIGTMKNKTAL